MKATFRILGRFAKGSRHFFAFAVLAAAASILFNFLSPQIIRFTVDSVIGTEPMRLPSVLMDWIGRLGGRTWLRGHLMVCAAGVVICAALNGIFNFFSRMSIAEYTESLIRRMRDALFTHTQHLPFAWHTANQTGDIIQRCTSDVDVLRNFVSNQLLQVVRTVILVATALTLMFSMNAGLSLVALLFIPLVITYNTIFFSKISKKFRAADESEGTLTVAVQENLTGVRVVRAFGREKYELERFDQRNQTFADNWIKLGGTLGAYWGMGDLVTGLQMLSVTAAGAVLAARGDLTLGEFLVFFSYNQTLAWPVRALGRILSDMSKSGVSAGRLLEILDAEPEQPEPDALTPDLHGDIVFSHVTFGYGDQPVLRDLSFTVGKGTTLGVLGATGSGKSTLTYLLNRLYDLPEGSGKITISGTDLRKIDRQYLRRNVGVVLQEPFLFSKTIAENIAIAADRENLERIRHSASIAAVDDSIMDFADGYDTMVGERGVTLSGGQKQRVAIARTLMQNAPIMVFDDSMSAVDLETDAQIREALRRDTGESTVILISHRINTLMRADQILVLQDGHAAEFGTHAELIRQGGLYKSIYEMQSQAAGGEEAC
ncbi:MAG: ABC transporter ATP-binding protein [Clostridiaceae bacterium]|nr:ABC transporter ATP-binding protein [Clostridiaceae bacterium]